MGSHFFFSERMGNERDDRKKCGAKTGFFFSFSFSNKVFIVLKISTFPFLQEKAVKEFIESLETFVKQEKPKEEEEEKEEESEEEEEEEVGEGESWREDPLPPVGSCSFLDDNQKKEIGRKPELSQGFIIITSPSSSFNVIIIIYYFLTINAQFGQTFPCHQLHFTGGFTEKQAILLRNLFLPKKVRLHYFYLFIDLLIY